MGCCMKKEEIYEEIKMSYDDLQAYLVRKYGPAKCDFFPNPECRKRSKRIARGNEGLFCHHMDEDKGGNLSNPLSAKLQPFDWQRKERLVYCNILEHLILHMKIAILRQKTTLKRPEDIFSFFTTGGIYWMCLQINDMFNGIGIDVAWREKVFEQIEENYDDYIVLLKALLLYIEKNYSGEKAYGINGIYGYFDAMEETISKLCSVENDYEYKDIRSDLLACKKDEEVNFCVGALGVDYNGYGNVRYANIALDDAFGAENADEYISKALPMYCEKTVELDDTKPNFWVGEEIPPKAEELFYIVRFETRFKIKKNVEPFVRYRERDFLREPPQRELSENYNFKDKGWLVLSTSDILNPSTGKYVSKYIGNNGETIEATVTLTLGKEDFLLFKKTHNIRYLKILDGCYFC